MDRARNELTFRSLNRAYRPRSVFEIGFGSGGLLRRFHDRGVQIGGADPGQLGVNIDPTVREHGRLWTGAIEDLPPDFFSADLVVGVHVIEHVPDALGAMQRAATILRPGGHLVLVTPAGDSWGPSTFGSRWWMLEDPTHLRFFTQESLRLAAQRAGLTDIRVRPLIQDSISVDVASLFRVVRQPGPAGALDNRAVLAGAVLSAPLVLGMRALRPRTRPSLQLVAVRAR